MKLWKNHIIWQSRYIVACITIALTIAGCQENVPEFTPKVFEVSKSEFPDVSYEGATLEVRVSAYDKWSTHGGTDWCRPSIASAMGDTTMMISVDPNINRDRECTIELKLGEDSRKIRVVQPAMPEGREIHYKLPVIFHVLYTDADDPSQNPDAQYIYQILDEVNAIYHQAGPESVDMNLEVVPATHDPDGNGLKEPGIVREYMVSNELYMEDVMLSQSGEYNKYIWDPNRYVNVLLYRFKDKLDPEVNQVMGVSTFPYTPGWASLPGTKPIGNLDLKPQNLKYAHCISLNNSYTLPRSYAFPGRPLDNRQLSMSNTLAHELGHYLGLYHIFSESDAPFETCVDTDYCRDTYSYNMEDYKRRLTRLIRVWLADESYRTDENYLKVFERESCTHGAFVSHNIMDYVYSYLDRFTADQRKRVRHVLTYSPLIPGPKKVSSVRSMQVEGPVDLPVQVMCMPRSYKQVSLK